MDERIHYMTTIHCTKTGSKFLRTRTLVLYWLYNRKKEAILHFISNGYQQTAGRTEAELILRNLRVAIQRPLIEGSVVVFEKRSRFVFGLCD